MVTKKTGPTAYIVPMGAGLDTFVYRELEDLLLRGHSIVLFATKFKKGDVYAPKPEWPVYKLPVPLLVLVTPLLLLRCLMRPALLYHSFVNGSLIDLLFAQYYAPHIRRLGIKNIHCHFGDHKLFIGYYCKKLTSLPLSVTIHSHELHVNPNEKMFCIALQECDHVFAISNLAVGILTNRYHVPPERVTLNRLYVDSSVWKHDAPIRVISVGRFQPQKGFEDLIAAAKILKDEDIEFVIVGWGPQDVRGIAVAAGIEHKFVFFEKLDQQQLRLLYQSVDIFCLPSYTHPEQGKEGVPVVLMEAMACSLSVVATRCGAVDEIVEDILVDERSPSQLADSIKQLANDPQLREVHGKRNRAIVEQKYSIGNIEPFAATLARLASLQ